MGSIWSIRERTVYLTEEEMDMDRNELEKYNVGENLDALMTKSEAKRS